ncbi:LarC family nickel insertion protein [Adlercreutzia equolifaciens]|uniref:LarC family nickel insertion protein n=1 Tax=Adlercreutzia equolifaciens TaxID=446660 RepID=UPI0023B1E203|nr:LarC family nickel insertion protein [Adlercreutzia equolifaciens]MDE8703410.1 LarC family nickel insertion protein [Adlercreutzia equolifaciens]
MSELLYLECTAGISGDMAAAALLDVGADEAAVRRALDSLPVEGFSIEISRVTKSGLDVCDFNVVLDEEHENHDHDLAYLHGQGPADGKHECGHGCEQELDHEHGHTHGHGHTHEHGHERGHDHGREREHSHGHSHDHGTGHDHIHRGLRDIEEIIQVAAMTDGAKELARAMFAIVADAEARAHGIPVDKVHFHEVGAVDSIADIVAIAVAVDSLAPAGVVVTDLPCGYGTVRCQHGLIPVPAPATAFIAQAHGIALTPVPVEGELVTPTGAAVVAALRTQDRLPERFVIKRIGMGGGKRAYETSGILRAMLIEPLA